MKKKLIICLLLVFTSLSLIGYQKEETKEMTNPDFGKYNGIYKMKDYKLTDFDTDEARRRAVELRNYTKKLR
jgi:hypothetical protein